MYGIWWLSYLVKRYKDAVLMRNLPYSLDRIYKKRWFFGKKILKMIYSWMELHNLLLNRIYYLRCRNNIRYTHIKLSSWFHPTISFTTNFPLVNAVPLELSSMVNKTTCLKASASPSWSWDKIITNWEPFLEKNGGVNSSNHPAVETRPVTLKKCCFTRCGTRIYKWLTYL